ncbi:MAG: hypothetical protein IVW57_06830, partial [Ktedonobacterales bacterium]|nr:hypothetical protein [Ktedonobacterales bacterium]
VVACLAYLACCALGAAGGRGAGWPSSSGGWLRVAGSVEAGVSVRGSLGEAANGVGVALASANGCCWPCSSCGSSGEVNGCGAARRARGREAEAPVPSSVAARDGSLAAALSGVGADARLDRVRARGADVSLTPSADGAVKLVSVLSSFVRAAALARVRRVGGTGAASAVRDGSAVGVVEVGVVEVGVVEVVARTVRRRATGAASPSVAGAVTRGSTADVGSGACPPSAGAEVGARRMRRRIRVLSWSSGT